MWAIHGTKSAIALGIFILAQPVTGFAEDTNSNKQYGFSLPTAPMPGGFDEVRAADGTTCRSSMAGNGAYLDLGGISNQDTDGAMNGGTVYGRVIIPLGKRPGRIDCRSLYQLEIDRLKHELRMARSGLNAGEAVNASSKDGWQTDGWNNN